MKADIDADVLVVGAGIIGLSLAVALANAGVSVVIVDRALPKMQTLPQYDGRASAIALGSWQLFENIGLGAKLRTDAQPIFDIRVADAKDTGEVSSMFLHFDHREIGGNPFGFMIENRVIRRTLLTAISAHSKVKMLAPNTIEEVSRDEAGVFAFLDDGRSVASRLLVAADGSKSIIRKRANIIAKETDYTQTAIVATIRHQLSHDGVAVEKFYPSGPFAMLPMTGNRTNIIWTEKGGSADQFLALSDFDFKQEIGRRVGGWLGEIELEGPRFCYPLKMLQAERYAARRLVLVGDAAHVIHPVAGQGLNLGLRDVASIAEIVVDSKRIGLDVGDSALLGRYERWRRFDNTVLAFATDGLNRLFSNDLPMLRLVRDLGLFAVGNLPVGRHFFMRHAMGVIGKLPRLVQGKSL